MGFYIAPGMLPIYLITIVFMVVGMIVGSILKKKMTKYGAIRTRSGMTGKEIAERMLRDNNISDVRVVEGQGLLTDHYNPLTKTVSLSPMVYGTPSIAAAAVAAHEVGHAVQHAKEYPWLQLRSKLVPVVQYTGFMVQIVLVIGILIVNTFPQLLLAGIVLFGITTAFTVITLPVEFDASRRALAWIDEKQIATGEEYRMAKDGLKWAASTYVIAALQSIATLLYYILIYMSGARRRD